MQATKFQGQNPELAGGLQALPGSGSSAPAAVGVHLPAFSRGDRVLSPASLLGGPDGVGQLAPLHDGSFCLHR